MTEVTMQASTAPKQRMQQIWAAGDFSKIATGIVIIGELLCESADLRAGQAVLDVATGSGNTAIAAARRFCEVTGVDFVPALLARARERAAAEGLDIVFQEGDCEHLPFADGIFDAVFSTFGVMFAGDQQKAADELLRVCRPGGKICLTTWVPEGYMVETHATIARYAPPPPGMPSPMAWGSEQNLTRFFGAGVASMQVTRRRATQRYLSAQHWLLHMRSNFGPILLPFSMLGAPEREKLAEELLDLAARHNQSGDGTLVLPLDYLEIVALRR